MHRPYSDYVMTESERFAYENGLDLIRTAWPYRHSPAMRLILKETVKACQAIRRGDIESVVERWLIY